MSPPELKDSTFFKHLQQRERAEGFSIGEIAGRVEAIIREVEPILQQVCRAFPEYTLHDPAHGSRVLANMGKLIPPIMLERLNSIEISILVYAAFLHDIGMAASQNELLKWLQSGEGNAFITANQKWSDLLGRFQEEKNEIAQRRVEDMAFTDYLRQQHGHRGAEFVMSFFGPRGKSDNKIAVRDVNYADYVALVCGSHCEDAMKLRDAEYRREALVREHTVNLQYLAVILRLADLCDLDPARTPKVVLDFINPQDPKSVEEWQKHRSIRGWRINDKSIRFEAKCSHPAIQRGLREWMEYIDSERRACLETIRDNRAEITGRYELNLTESIPIETIESDGSYIYTDFKFELDYEKIVALLMGTQLWKSPNIALRELLENSLDTCRHRQALSKRYDVLYKPQIEFIQRDDADGTRVIICEDNGMGMSQHIIQNYFMRIGRTYYQSPQFRQQNLDFSPISQFGLGIMSCFMLVDKIIVETRHMSGDLQRVGKALRVEIDGLGRYFVLRSGTRAQAGTTIVLRGPSNRVNLQFALGWIAPHPPFDIVITDNAEQQVIRNKPHKLLETTQLIYRHRSERPEFMAEQVKRYDFELTYEQTHGLQGNIVLLFLKDPSGNLTWERKEGDVTFSVAVNGSIEYRKWRKGGGVEERGVIEVEVTGHTWSQDGIRIQGSFPIGWTVWLSERSIHMPVPCFVDMDLQGPWKLGLNVAREEYDYRDKRFPQFKERFYTLVATLFKQVLEKENLLPVTATARTFVDELFRRSEPLLREKLRAAVNYHPKEFEL